MSMVTEILVEADYHSRLAALAPSTLLVLSFHTPWAQPCAQMSTILSTLASTYPVTNPAAVLFLSVNAEELPSISEAYDVSAVPFLVLLKDGKVLETVSGIDAAKVREAVEKHAGQNSRAVALPPLQKTVAPDMPYVSNGTSTAGNLAGPTGNTNSGSTLTDSKDELFARLSSLVKAAPVMLFMKGTPTSPQCGFSRQLVALLRERSIRYGFFNILADEEVRQGLKEFAEWPTFPQLWVNGELVGGLDIVKEELNSDPEFLKAYAVE
ncbi:MAG: monothiol glutaredoxin grx4 [Trizodia sp. TS-e1964]|nr:MAG: monothiol glutaredoxin grx4 [Trizodia sp. TS-e1964]